MKHSSITVDLRDGAMGAYLAVPERTPAGLHHRHHGDLGCQ